MLQPQLLFVIGQGIVIGPARADFARGRGFRQLFPAVSSSQDAIHPAPLEVLSYHCCRLGALIRGARSPRVNDVT